MIGLRTVERPSDATALSGSSQSDGHSAARLRAVDQHAVVTSPAHRAAKQRSERDLASNENIAVATTLHPDGRRSDRGPASAPLVGKRVGRYVIDRLLGKGGMATVWRAVHEDLGGEVAIKILSPEAMRGDGALERFFQEARVSAQLNHEHVVRVIDFARDPEIGSYIVMELLNGKGLDRVLAEEGPLDESRVVALALQLTDALAAAHALGIIHRDLKPANIFVTRTLGTETVKVMDFGIAKIPSRSNVALTRPGEIYGTPLYMSPEQWDDGPITEATDIYSLGVVLYELLTGKPPLDGSALSLARSIALGHTPPPLAYHRASISPDLDAIVQRCLRKRPEERFASMRELRAALREVQDSLDITYTSPAPDSLVPPARPARRGLVGVATVVAVVAVVAAASFAGVRLRAARLAVPDHAPAQAAAAHVVDAPPSPAPSETTLTETTPEPETEPAEASTATAHVAARSSETPRAAARPGPAVRTPAAPSGARRPRTGSPPPPPRTREAGRSKGTPAPADDDLLRKD